MSAAQLVDLVGAGSAFRTVYRFDVRQHEAFELGHVEGFVCVPGGQLVQETDQYAPVRGALIVLWDDGGTEADVAGSWLAQMGWDVGVLDGVQAQEANVQGPPGQRPPRAPSIETWSPQAVVTAGSRGDIAVLDVGRYDDYRTGHVAGAIWVSRSALRRRSHQHVPVAETYVVTARERPLIAWAVADLSDLLPGAVVGLEGGTNAWITAGLPVCVGEGMTASEPLDRYRRPYEGTHVPADTMRAYLEWEYGLVDQLERDDTHGFRPLALT